MGNDTIRALSNSTPRSLARFTARARIFSFARATYQSRNTVVRMGKLTLAAGYLEAAIIAIVCAILGQSEGRCWRKGKMENQQVVAQNTQRGCSRRLG
jgi:hypothetical protein